MKILQIFIISFLLSLLVQYWFFPQKTSVSRPEGIYLSVEKDVLTLPNLPKIYIHNTTTGSLSFNPCEKVSFSINSQSLSGISLFAPEFCHPVSIAPQTTSQLSVDALYRVFAAQYGKYIITLQTNDGDRVTSFDIEQP